MLCWGRNDEGQLGAPGAPSSAVPRALRGLGGCVELTAGAAHTCLRDRAGTVTCWGDGRDGQTGVLADGPVPPSRVAGVAAALSVSAGGATTCAVLASGRALCWGRGRDGQLGDGTRTPRRAQPSPVQGVAAAVEVAVGTGSACVRNRGGTLDCWGEVGEHKLNLSPPRQLLVPTRTPAIDDAVRIAVGAAHVCALRRGGELACKWSNFFGQLGNGTDRSFSGAPGPVRALGRTYDMTTGEVHTCARDERGVSCWGFGETGQLGHGGRDPRTLPAPVVGLHEDAP